MGKSIVKKCTLCKKRIQANHIAIDCITCKKSFHKKCSIKNSNVENWECDPCLLNNLPFFNLENTEFGITLDGRSLPKLNTLNILPSFSIQTLLDKISGAVTIETDEFLADTIESKYYKPEEFITAKIPKNTFSILHLNVASLQAHIDDLKSLLALLNHPFHIIGITETKILDGKEPLIKIDIDGYVFENTPTKTSFGGSGLYIRSDLDFKKCKNLSKSVESVAESSFVEIFLKNNKKFLVGSIYRHHQSISYFVENFLSDILHIINKSKKICALMGDFNVDLLKIDQHEESNLFYNVLTANGFRPLILQPSRVTKTSATLIDNIFINDMASKSKGGNLVSSISDHFAQFSSLDIFPKKRPNALPKFGRTYKNFSHSSFSNEMNKINWSQILHGKNTDSQIETILANTTALLDKMAPIKKLTKREAKAKQVPWLTMGILKSIGGRDSLHKKFLKEKNLDKKATLFSLYKIKRNIITDLIRSSKKIFYQNYFQLHQSNAKKTWEGIRNVLNVSKKDLSSPSKLTIDEVDIYDPKIISEKFNDFFVNIGNKVEAKIPKPKSSFLTYLNNRVSNSMFIRPIDDDEVFDMLKKLDKSKSSGPNSIPTNLLKDHAAAFVLPLKLAINQSFVEGKFPDLLKIAKVCPVFKKGERNLRENYRPISLLSNLSKIFERAMHTRLYSFIEEFDSFYDLQYGFRKKYSTDHALLSIVEEIRQNLDNGLFSCGVFVDLEKAFDTVNHKNLLAKLEHYGVRSVANDWFRSYLSNRSQLVDLGNDASSSKNVTCGVPQGSILGPLLFLLYINDMRHALKFSVVHHFADDTNLLYSHKNQKILRKNINTDLELLFQWLCANRLSLNVKKTEFIIFRPARTSLKDRVTLTLNGCKIFESTKVKYLGIILDPRLTWKHHIFELSKKLSRSVGMLYNMKKLGCDDKILLSLYYSLFQSHLGYGLAAWGSSVFAKNLFVIQKRAIRALFGLSYNDSTSDSFRKFKILSLENLYRLKLASLMWDFDHSLLPSHLQKLFKYSSEIHSYGTRSSENANLARNFSCNTQVGSLMLKFMGPKVLNSLKNLSFYHLCHTKHSFISKYKTYLLDNP